MAFGAMGGAGGSWDDEEKKKRERLRNTNSVLGISGIGQMANEAAGFHPSKLLLPPEVKWT